MAPDTVQFKLWLTEEDATDSEEEPFDEFEIPVIEGYSLSKPPVDQHTTKNIGHEMMYFFAIEMEDVDEPLELMAHRDDRNVPNDPDAVRSAIGGGIRMEANTPAHEQPPAGFSLIGNCKFWAKPV